MQELKVRTSKRQAIYDLFRANVDKKLSSHELHMTFGSSFRARVSEINLDPSSHIRILNKVNSRDDAEVSVYWATLKDQEVSESRA